MRVPAIDPAAAGHNSAGRKGELMTVVDLNSDVGESFGRWMLGDDAAVLTSSPAPTSPAAFTPATRRRCADCELAAARGVVMGAQVGYRDLAGFGRRFIDVTGRRAHGRRHLPDRRAAGARPRRRRRGALRQAARRALQRRVDHEAQAGAVVDAVAAVDPALPVLGLPGSALLERGRAAGLRGGAPRPSPTAPTHRTAPSSRGPSAGAVLSDPAAVAARAVRMVAGGAVVAVDGERS